MVKKAIHNLLRHRHFWRDVGFTELSEVYISMLFRSLSISVTTIFIPLYMLNLGYSFQEVLAVGASYFIARFLFFDIFSGWLTSLIGPKHTIIISYFVLTLSTLQFLTLPTIDWPVWLLGAIWGASTSLFCIPFHVDFARIQHKDHGGKELAYVNILTKVGAVIGPIVSGVVGGLFGGQYIFLAAILLLIIGGLPLLTTAEPLAIGRKLNLGSIKLKNIRRDILSFMALSVEHTASITLWPIFLGMFIVAGSTAYAKLGFLASFSVIVSIGAAYTIGRLVDAHRGRRLMRWGTVLNAVIHAFRPMVSGYPGAIAVNAANEAVTMSYNLPYVKGMYDAGDAYEDRSVAYFTLMEMFGSYARSMFWIILFCLASFMTDRSIMTLGFAIGAVASLLIMTEKFPALSVRKKQ